jgi:hypothetical protein
MYISEKLKKDNIIGYLLYMWQVEDIVRANKMDIDNVEQTYISRFDLNEDQHKSMRQWYSDIIGMMRSEDTLLSGHLQINKNVIINLTDLHHELLKSSKHPFYSAAYYKVLPYLVEFRNKSNGNDKPELENCFDALYAYTTLRLQNKELSSETSLAVGEITKFLGMLAELYKKEKDGTLEL